MPSLPLDDEDIWGKIKELISEALDEYVFDNPSEIYELVKQYFSQRIGQNTIKKTINNYVHIPIIPTTDLVGWWQLNNSAAKDSSKYGNDGTLGGSATTARDVLEMYAAGDYVDCGTDGSLEITGDQTWIAWVRPENFDAIRTIVCKGASTTARGMYTTTGRSPGLLTAFYDYATTDATSTGSTALTLGVWQQVAAVLKNKKFSLYLNGTELGYNTQVTGVGAAVAYASDSFDISMSATYPFIGQIDEVRVYKRALSAYEIQRLYEEQNRRFDHVNETFGAMRLFEVQHAATAGSDGIYDCYEQMVEQDEWADTAGDQKVSNRNTTEVEVLNLAEFNPEGGYIAHLAAGDLLAAFRCYDDEGYPRWVGIPFREGAHGAGVRIAYCQENAPAATSLTCFLDVDATGTEIEVNCIINPSANLNAATPRLVDGDKILVCKIGADWYCTNIFMGDITCTCVAP